MARTGPGLWLAALVLVAGAGAAAWLAKGRVQPVAAGYPAPDFSATDEHGGVVTLADYRGKVLLLNVWATWCGPCEEEMPSMQRLYDQFSRDDFEIAAVSIDAPVGGLDLLGNPGGDPVAFARELGLTFPVLQDPAGAIRRTYRTTGVPESFLIGPRGMIWKKVAGATAWDSEAAVAQVRRLVEERAWDGGDVRAERPGGGG